jgi:hypothetical protein
VLALNTYAAKVQSTETGDVRIATASILTGLGGDGSLPFETALVLIFEKGQKRTQAIGALWRVIGGRRDRLMEHKPHRSKLRWSMPSWFPAK